jgi:hypothetical protein
MSESVSLVACQISMIRNARSVTPALAIVVAVTLSACAGPSRTTDTTPPPTAGPPPYETFDPAGYDVRPPAVPVAVEHDVPPRLMEGRVEVPARGPAVSSTRVVDGFRVQVFTSDDRASAERVRAEAEAWARGQGGPAGGLRGEVAYLQPYYRVRLGEFESRDEAELALAAVRARYPEAFLVPDLVTIGD